MAPYVTGTGATDGATAPPEGANVAYTHEAAELPYLQAEENRLLYVAATRAKQLLIVSRQVPQKGTAAWGVLNNSLPSTKELTVPARVSAMTPSPASCSPDVQAEAGAARSKTQDAVTPPSWSITSVTAEAKHIAKMAGAAEPVAVDDATRVVAQDTPSHRADAGMAWGTLIHGLLEHAMRHRDASREGLRRLALWLIVDEPQLKPVIELAVDTVLRVARAPFWVEARAAEHCVKTPFLVSCAQNQLLSGVIDLLHQSEQGWLVADYKSDIDPVDSMPEQYQHQLMQYRQALGACGLVSAGAVIRAVRTEREANPLVGER